jgi:hypothetical protein
MISGVIEFARNRNVPATAATTAPATPPPYVPFGCAYFAVSLDQVETLNRARLQVRPAAPGATPTTTGAPAGDVPGAEMPFECSRTLWKTESDVSSAVRVPFQLCLPLERGSHQFSSSHFGVSYTLRVHLLMTAFDPQLPASSEPSGDTADSPASNETEPPPVAVATSSVTADPPERRESMFFSTRLYHFSPGMKTTVHRFSIPLSLLPIISRSPPSPNIYTFKF